MTSTSFGVALDELQDWRDEREFEEREAAAKRKEDAQDVERDRLPYWERQRAGL